LADRMLVAQLRHVERAACAMKGALARLIVLGALENRQYIVVAPAAVAQLRPVVVVPPVTPCVAHGIDRRRATQRLAAWNVNLAVVEVFLRDGVVAPV